MIQAKAIATTFDQCNTLVGDGQGYLYYSTAGSVLHSTASQSILVAPTEAPDLATVAKRRLHTTDHWPKNSPAPT